MSVRGFVVAGGRSSRMGKDKAELPYRGGTLLDHALSLVRDVTSDVRILCGPKARYEDHGVPVVVDAVCGAGPIGGLYSALVSARADEKDRVLWLAVDVPLVPSTLLRRLVDELDHAAVAMARTERGVEPLCAAFRVEESLTAVRRSMLDGTLKLTAALDSLGIRMVDADAAALTNLNSPEDLARIL